jgi:hypothetical protein
LAVAFFVRTKGLGQLVAVWQCSLRLLNVQSCYATLEYRLRNICSNEFGIYSHPIFQTFGFSAHSLCLHCSNLRQPFEPLLLFDGLARCGTKEQFRLLFFCTIFASAIDISRKTPLKKDAFRLLLGGRFFLHLKELAQSVAVVRK